MYYIFDKSILIMKFVIPPIRYPSSTNESIDKIYFDANFMLG